MHRLTTIAELPDLLDQRNDRNFLTCSAVLDVLRDRDIDALAQVIEERRLPALFSLSVTGAVLIHPEDPLDQRITDAFNAHQRTDKGFGPALGMAAVAEAVGPADRVGITFPGVILDGVVRTASAHQGAVLDADGARDDHDQLGVGVASEPDLGDMDRQQH